MERTLVFPWHGRVQGGQVHLKDGTTRPFPALPTAVAGATGPGDNHRIVVNGVAPLSEEEIARTPAGGEYWPGRALITAGMLYGTPIEWIYQALDGSRWSVGLESRTIETSSSSLRLRFRRFGEFQRAPEEQVRGISIPVGRLTAAERALFFADLGGIGDVVMRLHSVSPTGRRTILALMAHNSGEGFDNAPRAYTFVEISITGASAELQASSSVLYGKADIRKSSEVPQDTHLVPDVVGNEWEEVDREPVYGADGARVGDRVTYDFKASVSLISTPSSSGLPGPTSYTQVQTWIAAVTYDGETPVPCTIRCTTRTERAMPNMSAVTDLQEIRYVQDNGQQEVEQRGQYHLEGSANSVSSATCSWEYPGGSWSRGVNFTTASTILETQVTNIYTADGAESSVSKLPYNQAGIFGYGLIEGNYATRKPRVSFGLGAFYQHITLDLYSNNLLGVSVAINGNAAVMKGGLTVDGFVPQEGPYPAEEITHYGSYNPFTRQIVLASIEPANWA